MRPATFAASAGRRMEAEAAEAMQRRAAERAAIEAIVGEYEVVDGSKFKDESSRLAS